MKVIAFLAMSADGYIADERGDEDFLSERHWKQFTELVHKHGVFIMGRKTYESVLTWGPHYTEDLAHARAIILSRGGHAGTVASPSEALALAETFGKETVVLAGGSEAFTSFLTAGLIDTLILSIEPIILGRGIQPFRNVEVTRRMDLKRTDSVGEIVRLEYSFV